MSRVVQVRLWTGPLFRLEGVTICTPNKGRRWSVHAERSGEKAA